MSYTNNIREIEMVPFIPATGGGPTANQNGLDLSQAADTVIGEWVPAVVPHQVHAIGIAPRTGHVRSDPVRIGFNCDISAQGTATRVGTIVLPTTVTAAGEVVYWKPTYTVLVNPGRAFQALVTTAATAGSYAKIGLLVSPCWEEPGNVTSMTQTT